MSASLPRISLPQGWPDCVKSAFICAVALARAAVVETRSWCINSRIARVRLAAENERLQSEVAMLREELRIKDARLGAIPAARRPHYPPTERLAILSLKAGRGWNNAQAARTETASHRHCQLSAPCLACGFECSANSLWFLGTLVSLRLSSMLAILLLGRRCRRPLLTQGRHARCLQDAAFGTPGH